MILETGAAKCQYNIPNDHQMFIDRAMPILKDDPRIIGVAAAGSLISGNMDPFSDLDLVVVSMDDSYPSIMKERVLIVEKLGKLLVSFTGEHVGEPRLLICLYDSPLIHVDIKFISLEQLSRRIENPVVLWERESKLTSIMNATEHRHPMPDMQWIEDRFWIWVHYAALKIGRGELFETIDFLSILRQTVFGPMSAVIHKQLPRGVRRIEIQSPRYLDDLKKTIASHNRGSCIDATRAAIDLYLRIRDDIGDATVIRRIEAQMAAVRYFNDISQIKETPLPDSKKQS